MIKRVFDLIIAAAGLLLLSPILIIISIIIIREMRSPILFRQLRPGLKGKPFELIKFRTMLDQRDKYGELLPDENRLTEFGKFLRSTSLDELPELWNVLLGHMSLVGPRPLLLEYLPLFNEEQKRRHDVKPGITGWAQINGRNSLKWEDRFAMDIWYVENQSFWLDVKIIFLTIKKVIFRENISEEGKATMSKFTGNE